MNPGRSSRASLPRQDTMVDSRPMGDSPPSKIMPTASPSSSRTCSGLVGLKRPKRLADGAAIPPPKAVKSCCAMGCEGTRIPMLSWPPVTTSFTLSAFGKIKVRGPGQNRAASFSATAGSADTQRCRYRGLSRCTMTGWSAGRPFTSNILRTAAGFAALAPRPYTVSVGNTTSSPARNTSTASSISVCVALTTGA